MKHSTEIIEKIAAEFAAIIRRDLTENELSAVIEINKTSTDCCATHDFIDANMSMWEAFTKVVGRDYIFYNDEQPETEQQNADDTDAMNRAWSIAKKAEFYLTDKATA